MTGWRYVWAATSSDLWPEGYLGIALANGDTFPDPAVYGEFWAQYSDSVNTMFKFPGRK